MSCFLRYMSNPLALTAPTLLVELIGCPFLALPFLGGSLTGLDIARGRVTLFLPDPLPTLNALIDQRRRS